LHVSTTVALIVAAAAAAVAAIALAVGWWTAIRVRRVRDAQKTLVGGGRKDLVDFAVSLQARIDDLHRAVDEVAAGLARVDRRIDGVISNSSIVRYDAYEDTGGHQSASLALLDSARTGIVVTAIQGRDYARIYMKELDRGRASVALSPEEQDAVDRAMGRGA
jgi:HAMP domain-containing protein